MNSKCRHSSEKKFCRMLLLIMLKETILHLLCTFLYLINHTKDKYFQINCSEYVVMYNTIEHSKRTHLSRGTKGYVQYKLTIQHNSPVMRNEGLRIIQSNNTTQLTCHEKQRATYNTIEHNTT